MAINVGRLKKRTVGIAGKHLGREGRRPYPVKGIGTHSIILDMGRAKYTLRGRLKQGPSTLSITHFRRALKHILNHKTAQKQRKELANEWRASLNTGQPMRNPYVARGPFASKGLTPKQALQLLDKAMTGKFKNVEEMNKEISAALKKTGKIYKVT